jgi:hypothetical protein
MSDSPEASHWYWASEPLAIAYFISFSRFHSTLSVSFLSIFLLSLFQKTKDLCFKNAMQHVS